MKPRLLLCAALAVLLGACASVPPRLAEPALRERAPLAGLPVDAKAGWPASDWWKRYEDPQLDALMGLVLTHSATLAEARARVAQATQSARITAAKAGLQVEGDAQLARHRMSEHGLIPSQFLGFTWYTQADLGLSLRHDFDWWGKHRAAVAAAVGQARVAAAQQAAATLALESAVADAYFGWQADHARLALAKSAVEVGRQLLTIARLRVGAGLEPPDLQHQAEAGVAAARQQQVALESSVQIRLAALASLLGVAPAALPPLEVRPLPTAATGLPPHASLDLVARRPDIAASRWRVEAALRGTDVARAQFLPDLSISALAGLSSIDLGKLLEAGSRTFALAPALHLPIFNGGLLQASYGLSKAKLDAAIAQYDAAVLDAAREVATQALTLQRIAAQRREQRSQLQAIQALHDSAAARQRRGVVDGRPALQARAQLLQQRAVAIGLHTEALTTGVALTRALGGGYRSDTPTSPSSSALPAPDATQ
ncbi:MAG TPA: efflux transporter outer membrane subunit [Rhodanobacteraceae bacterium]|nr:efflux transporter outer membrane subunit [Rhodanobacteraceae bacterium]